MVEIEHLLAEKLRGMTDNEIAVLLTKMTLNLSEANDLAKAEKEKKPETRLSWMIARLDLPLKKGATPDTLAVDVLAVASFEQAQIVIDAMLRGIDE